MSTGQYSQQSPQTSAGQGQQQQQGTTAGTTTSTKEQQVGVNQNINSNDIKPNMKIVGKDRQNVGKVANVDTKNGNLGLTTMDSVLHTVTHLLPLTLIDALIPDPVVSDTTIIVLTVDAGDAMNQVSFNHQLA